MKIMCFHGKEKELLHETEKTVLSVEILVIILHIKSITSCSLSSLSCTSFFTKSATNSSQAIISMRGKTKEMASRYLGYTEEPTINQNSRKPPITVNGGSRRGPIMQRRARQGEFVDSDGYVLILLLLTQINASLF